MFVSVKYRKIAHFTLFVFVVLIQVAIILLWKDERDSQKKLTDSYKITSDRNLIFRYSNLVTKHYFSSENFFHEYLHDYDPKTLEKYQISMSKMMIYLDSLSIYTAKNPQFSENISTKKIKEKEIIALHKELDSLINFKIKTNNISNVPLKLKPFNHTKILNSISYDTIKSTEEKQKKGFFKRIGDAINGKTDTKNERLQITMTMKLGDLEKSGTIEQQMFDIFKNTNSYYQNEFRNLQKTYTNLRYLDKELLEINKKIFENTQDIILFHNQSSHNLGEEHFEQTVEFQKDKQTLITYLIITMIICTFLLLAYSIYAYQYEKKLALAKIQADKNVDFKNRIIGMLSHEMRSPLNIISNLTQKLSNKNLDFEETKTLNLLNFTSNSLQITVNQVLDFFKNENSKLVLYNSKINLKLEIDTILSSLKSLASSKNIKLIAKIDESTDQEVWADYGKIHQLFYNLIGNSLKFTNQGNITVTAKLSPSLEKHRLDISISDTGVGIPPKDIEKVFDKYYQSTNLKEKISFGAGLGLNLCKEIIKLHGGEIAVESTLNEGTTVTFHLFLEKKDENKKNSQAQIISKFASVKKKVAIVDDDLLITVIVKKIFQNINFETAVFNSGPEIISYLETEKVDIVISDLQIGNFSGVQVIREIKAFKNSNSRVPIIVITGDANISKVDSSTIGADEILIKPINKEELYSKLLYLME